MGTVLRGAVTGLGEKFAFPRSYIRGFTTNWPSVGVSTLVGNEWRITLDASFGNAYKLMKFQANYFAWNSNCYTFGWIFEDFYVFVPPSTVQPAEGFNLHYRVKPGTRDFYLALDVGFWPDWFYIDLPAQPAGYWRQPP